MLSHEIVVDGSALTLASVMAVARGGATVRGSDSVESTVPIEASRRRVAQLVADAMPVYGITTRLGGLATGLLTADEAREIQSNAIWMHKTGAGRAIDREDVRAGMLLRMNSLMHGASGIRRALIDRLAMFLNHGVTPVVHEFGSIGASGDLVPLSYVAGALIGSPAGYVVDFRERHVDAREALRELGLEPLELEPKEALALINGTSMSTAIAARCLSDALRLFAATLGFHALALEALRANMEPFAAFVHQLKPHPGQVWVAQRIRALLEGSALTRATSGEPAALDGLIQDRYSIRCLPQFLGPIVEDFRHSRSQLEIEMNAVSDNPLIDAAGNVFQGGNFLAQMPAIAMDRLRVHLGLAAKHVDAQIALLMTPQFSAGLPASLVGNEQNRANMGLKGLQLTGNSMMPLLTFYGNSFIDRFPTHAEQFNQNINSLSYSASLLARESIRIYTSYLAVALIAAVQAVDLRAFAQSGSYDPRPLLAPATRRVYEALRAILGKPADAARPFVKNDNEQSLDASIVAVAEDLAGAGRVSAALGDELLP